VHPQPAGCSDDVYAVLLRCWEFEPAARTTFPVLLVEFHELVVRGSGDVNSTAKRDTSGSLINPSLAANSYADSVGVAAIEDTGSLGVAAVEDTGYVGRVQPVAALIGHSEQPVVPYGEAVTLPPRANQNQRKRSVPKLYTGGNVGPGMAPTEYLPVGKPNPVEYRAEGSAEPDRPVEGSYVTTKPRRNPVEHKAEGSVEPDCPVTPNTRPADDEGEAFDGFYEDAPTVAEHDRAIREAQSNASDDTGPGAEGTLDSSGVQPLHVPGVGYVDIYIDTEPNARDVLAETTFTAVGTDFMSC